MASKTIESGLPRVWLIKDDRGCAKGYAIKPTEGDVLPMIPMSWTARPVTVADNTDGLSEVFDTTCSAGINESKPRTITSVNLDTRQRDWLGSQPNQSAAVRDLIDAAIKSEEICRRK
jgi:hypothetical protein